MTEIHMKITMSEDGMLTTHVEGQGRNAYREEVEFGRAVIDAIKKLIENSDHEITQDFDSARSGEGRN